MSSLYRRHSIDAFYQVLLHFGLAISEKKIQMWKDNRRRMTDDGRKVMPKADMAFQPGELKRDKW
jgi:hypothetical protein